MSESRHSIPSNWTVAPVHELFDVVGGGTPSTDVAEYWQGTTPWISSADVDEMHQITPRRSISEQAIKNSATNRVPAGSVIVVTRVGLGKVGIAETPICFSQDSQALIFNRDLLLPKYVLLYMGTAVQIFKHISRGTTISGVTKKQLNDLEFRLPPLPEQLRIVEEIEKHFTRLDAAVAALKRVQINLKRYRAAVLKAASEGRLVASTSESSFTHSLLRPIKELISEPLANGRSPTSATSGAKILRLTSMQGNFIDFSEFRFGNLDDQNQDNLRVQEGDIFIARGSGSVHLVGRASFARTLPSEYIAFPDTMIRIRLNPAEVEPLYFIYLWNSAVVRSQIEGIARTTAGIHKISQKDIENITLPLVPLVDQRKVILALEQKFSMIDAVERTTALDSTRAERLRQAILKTAFEGKLVSQDPNDEPASVLLERIRAGRNATHKSAPTPSRGRRKKEAAYVS